MSMRMFGRREKSVRRPFRSMGLMVAGATALTALAPTRAAESGAAPSLKEFKLPPGVERLSYYGERPAWSPDGKKVAFVGKSFGDAFEIDIATREIRNLTAHFPHAGFLRVQYLADGNILLTGPRTFKDPKKARWEESELWVLDKSLRKAPVPLNQILFEGAAVGTKSNRIAWTETGPNWHYGMMDAKLVSETPKDDQFFIFKTGIVRTGADGRPTLTDVQEVTRIARGDCRAETQDFRDNDREITYSCLRTKPGLAKFAGLMDWSTMGVRIDNRKLTTYRRERATGWEEVEGISPDGSWTLIECGPEKQEGLVIIDLCRLDLDGKGGPLKRLTHFIDQGGSATNGVISPDGKWMAFMEVTDRTREPGTGDGILLMRLPQ